jgi:hypothetical protein
MSGTRSYNLANTQLAGWDCFLRIRRVACPCGTQFSTASRNAIWCPTCHYRKLRPDTLTSFDQLILAEAGMLIDPPLYHGIGRKVGRAVQCPKRRVPRVKTFVLGRKTSQPGGVEASVRNVTTHNVAKQACQATVFNIDGIPDWEVPLVSAHSWIARRYNLRPEQKVAHQTGDARQRTPDTRISSHLPALTANHIISSCPSIRLRTLSAKIRKHSIAASS